MALFSTSLQQSAPSSSSVLQEIDRLITCKVCFRTYVNPHRLFSCGHSVCAECLFNDNDHRRVLAGWQTRSTSGMRMCPVCSAPASSRDISRDLFLTNILQSINHIRHHVQKEATDMDATPPGGTEFPSTSNDVLDEEVHKLSHTLALFAQLPSTAFIAIRSSPPLIPSYL